MTLQIRTPDPIQQIAARVAGDFGAFAYDGFGIMLSDEQLQARAEIGRPGPRESPQAPRWYWLSGGQRSGKTVFGFLLHAEACLFKVGVDVTDQLFWRNYQYKTLNIAPSDELALRLWAVGDSISKNVNDAQYDKGRRRARGGAFLPLVKAETERRWGIIRFAHSLTGPMSRATAWIDFRSSEGKAKRLEGTFWRFFTWDEWASQPDGEIEFVMDDVLQGRARDADAKIMPMAWPKAETERHLIAVERALETGVGRHAHDSRVIYLSAEKAHFTNTAALAVERGSKDEARWKRTVLGKTAGGASIEFTLDIVANMIRADLQREPRREGFRYLSSWDLGLGRDSTVGLTWRIPIVDGRPVADQNHKARIVNWIELKGGDDLTIDRIAFEVSREQQAYQSLTAVDATGMGGLGAVRALRDMSPPPLSFKSRSNDRIWGNMRLAAITNGLDLTSWGKPSDEVELLVKAAQAAWDYASFGRSTLAIPRPEIPPWGLIEAPRVVELIDQLANFDRDAKDGIPDDWVWSFLIGAWYIRRYWAVLAKGVHVAREFDVRGARKPSRIIKRVAPVADHGIRSIVVRR